MKLQSLIFATFLAQNALAGIGEDGICRTTACMNNECTFNVKLDLMAGELGYYTFEECGDVANPTIGMEVGVRYRFLQSDISNWYHPIGFGYEADGAHDAKDEVEPGVAAPGASDESCIDSLTCPSPMYFKDGTYVGSYSNDADILPLTSGDEDFGLDNYEPLFFYPLDAWLEMGDFSATLTYPDTPGFGGDIFYFCHIHQYMTGRIKLLKNDVAVQLNNKPDIPYRYDEPSEYDSKCGTYGLDMFQLPHAECPDRFVCSVPGADANPELAHFSDCIDSMNCHMFAGMTTNVNAGSEAALFLHQMIPHHQNAVNMSKALVKTKTVNCDRDAEEEDLDCALETILREIINVQNAQIQAMRGILAEKYPSYPKDDCTVEIQDNGNGSRNKGGSESSAFQNTIGMAGLGAAGLVLSVV